MNSDDYAENRRIGLDWVMTYQQHRTDRPSRFAITHEGDLLCRTTTTHNSRYVVVKGVAHPDGQLVRYNFKSLKLRIPVGSLIDLTTTMDPRDEDCAGVYRDEHGNWAIHTIMAEIYQLTGPIGPGAWGTLDHYRPINKGVTTEIVTD